MKTKFLHIATALLFVGFTSSCSDFLDRYPLDELSDSSFWKTENDAMMAVTDIYGCLPTWDQDEDINSDNAVHGIKWAAGNISKGVYDPMDQSWAGSYTPIRQCNLVLEKVKDIEMSDESRKKIEGQAYFFRAMQLFDLVRVYGAVPVVNKVLMAADREGAKDYNRESVETCVNQILSDLKEAANLLPTRKEWGSDQYGRLTKEAALAYRSRVALVFASPIFNADWNNTGSKRWKDALDITLEAQAFLSSEGYGLYGNSAKDWNEMFYKFDNQECKEVIMVKLLASSTSKNDEHS